MEAIERTPEWVAAVGREQPPVRVGVFDYHIGLFGSDASKNERPVRSGKQPAAGPAVRSGQGMPRRAIPSE
jgi:hypothetical protein